MRPRKNKTKVTLTGKQVSALLASIAAIAILSLLVGYISGKMLNTETVEIVKEKETPKSIFGGMAPRHLDPADVEKETTVELPVDDTFSFHKKLEHETDPANKPLPKSTVPEESRKPVNVVTKKPERSSTKKKAPKKTTKVARSVSKPKPKSAKRPETVNRNSNVKKLTIQVGSFKHKKEASTLVRKLKKKGYRAYVVPFNIKGESWSRVRVGVFDSTISAKKTARILERDLKLPTLLVSYQGGR